MNLITKISESSLIYDKVAIKYAVYFFMISGVYEEDEMLYSDYTKEEIVIKFKKIKDEIIEEALLSLKKSGLVKGVIVGGEEWFGVGYCVEGINVLFTREENAENIFNPVESAISSYIVDASGYVKAKAKNLKRSFEFLKTKKVSEYAHADFVSLFQICYECFFQEDARPFMQKDHGMLKNFISSYDSTVVCKMIIYYFLHSEKFGRSPSLSVLLYKRDEVYMQMKGKNKAIKSKSSMRDILDNEEF